MVIVCCERVRGDEAVIPGSVKRMQGGGTVMENISVQ